jgi:type IV pilus assembly protein PilN
MRIRINLATRPYANLGPALKRLRLAMGVLALLGAGFGLGLFAFHEQAVEARARERAVDGNIAAIERERTGYQQMMAQPDNALLLKQASTLNALFDEKGFSWTLAMEDLERVLPAGVQVTTLEPQRAKDGHITLRMRVAGPRDRAVELVQNLEHSRRFLLPRIVSEGAEQVQGANQQQQEPVSASNRFSFDLMADYNPAGISERRPAGKPEAGKPAAAKTETPAAPAVKPPAARVAPAQPAASERKPMQRPMRPQGQQNDRPQMGGPRGTRPPGRPGQGGPQ